MTYVYSSIGSFIVGVLVFMLTSTMKENRKLRQEKEKQEADRNNALENGVRCLLRAKLIEYHAKYTALGYISSHGLENGNLMYNAYKALGGNGLLDQMNEEIKHLPVKD